MRAYIIDPLLTHLGYRPLSDKAPSVLEFELEVSKKADILLGSSVNKDKLFKVDYLLYLDRVPICVLEAKAPHKDISKGSNAQKQAKSYILAYDTPYYALCNGLSFILFDNQKELLNINIKENYDKLIEFKDILLGLKPKKIIKNDEWYINKLIPNPIENPQKQKAKRHFGCTAYFTRQSWDVVSKNINHFTCKGDIVLDSFGGSGVSAIEAMMNGRIGIHIDLNPLSVFMARAMSMKIDLNKLSQTCETILKDFAKMRPKDEKEANNILKDASYYPNAISKELGTTATLKKQEKLWIPLDEILPKGSDVASISGLFSPMQYAELAILRKLIMQYSNKDEGLRYALFLAFYNTVNLINLTYHETKSRKGAAGASFSTYYRYRLAKMPYFLDTAETFKRKLERVIKGKKELEASESFYTMASKSIIAQGDATSINIIKDQSVDFIYTDPPYGAKIPYLDLSTMWNAWLDLRVDEDTKSKECIQKGSLNKSQDEYIELMIKSLKEMYRVLKYNRWLAFVFQHQDPKLWQEIVDNAQKIGFEYIGSIRQSNGQTSFKKRQNPLTVLSGQLIMYFKKIKNPKNLIKEDFGDDIANLVINNIEALIVKNQGATLEEIYAELQIKGLELGFLHELAKNFENLTSIINSNFDLEDGKYHIRQKQGQELLKNHNIDIKLRTKYFLLSYLRKKQRQNIKAFFDDIVLDVIPLLKNGITPSNELIKDVLRQIAIENKENNEWILKENATIFNLKGE